ncbi:polyprenyl synthetase family protein [Patulibacter minatonensis]|uniref:polyprenyl synthetase family protein n=1 Tax=Patulibacter minatonensis TaxID=298163 RepID=UPI000688DBF9|nr:polyprenyl synthetase family protein [Patulibacter minatonensis]
MTTVDGAPEERVPAAVVPILAAAGAHVPVVLGEVERALRSAASPGDSVLDGAAFDTVAAGGKRLRPLLAIVVGGPQVAEPGSAARAAVVRAGVAVELTHTATLLHDDVLDAGLLRRGRPTAFAKSGRAAATCLGDVLFAGAFATLASGGQAAALQVLARASRELAQGELLQRADAWDADVGEDRYLHRCHLKTGALFEAAARLGALAAGEDDDAFARFASAIGVAFQLFDDVLDVVAPPEQTGKPRGTDLLDGTVTLPMLIARERDASLAALDLRSITTPEHAAEVCDRIAATGATAETEARAEALVADGVEALPAGLDEARATALRLVARGVVDRRL